MLVWSSATPGLKEASLSRAFSRSATSATGSGSRKSASGAILWAAPSGIPSLTPSSSADRLASRTLPSVHGLPPRTIGTAANGVEDRLQARRRRRWGQ